MKYFWYKSGCNRLVLPNRTEQQIEIFQKSQYDLVRIPNDESCIYLFFLLKVNVVTTHNMMEHAWLVDTPEWEKKKKKITSSSFLYFFSVKMKCKIYHYHWGRNSNHYSNITQNVQYDVCSDPRHTQDRRSQREKRITNLSPVRAPSFMEQNGSDMTGPVKVLGFR